MRQAYRRMQKCYYSLPSLSSPARSFQVVENKRPRAEFGPFQWWTFGPLLCVFQDTLLWFLLQSGVHTLLSVISFSTRNQLQYWKSCQPWDKYRALFVVVLSSPFLRLPLTCTVPTNHSKGILTISTSLTNFGTHTKPWIRRSISWHAKSPYRH